MVPAGSCLQGRDSRRRRRQQRSDDTKTFSYEVTLTEGQNTITVVSTDSIGKSTTVTRHVTLDTKALIITDVHAEAVTVNAGGQVKITFKVTDPEA